MIGPKGEVIKEHGVIVAGRHIHMPKFIADIKGYKDGDIVKVETCGERKVLLYNVLMRWQRRFIWTWMKLMLLD